MLHGEGEYGSIYQYEAMLNCLPGIVFVGVSFSVL